VSCSRSLLHGTQDTLKDAKDCGKLGKPGSRTLETRQCMSTCTWRTNPLYKNKELLSQASSYGIMWNERKWTANNTFPILTSTPQVPAKLKCLKDCINPYNTKTKKAELRRKCSPNGIDTQVSKHKKSAQAYEKSNYSDSDNFNYGNLTLDCLVFYGTKVRTGCKTPGVCNFIADPGPTTYGKKE